MAPFFVASFFMIQSSSHQQTPQHIPFGNHPIKVLYTNWRGETAERLIVPMKIYFGSTEYYKEEQWLLQVWDVERGAQRVYALKEIKQWFVE